MRNVTGVQSPPEGRNTASVEKARDVGPVGPNGPKNSSRNDRSEGPKFLRSMVRDPTPAPR
jgi:hypothetical protein